MRKSLILSSIVAFLSLFLVGFDLSSSSIPKEEILSGGPPKDGIPAILKPKFIKPSEARFLKENDRILGIYQGGLAKAYPIKILNWHEVVNDSVGGRPVVITYCPLCGTGMAFDPMVNGRRLTFGVSGLLYKSDVLFYDHQTESLWSQILREAVTGKAMLGKRLTLLPLTHTTWKAWRKERPETLVLSTDTGYRRDYSKDPYNRYEQSAHVMFPVGEIDKRYLPKSWVLGLELGDATKAYPFSELERSGGSFTDSVASKKVTIQYDSDSRTARVRDVDGKEIPSVMAYWFAWMAFHPDTEVYKAKK